MEAQDMLNLVMERRRRALMQPVRATILRDQLMFSHEMELAVLRLETDIFGHKVAQADLDYTVNQHVDCPATPWDMFKEQHARSWWLGWLVRRHPARTEPRHVSTVVHGRVTKWDMYPSATIKVPENFGPVVPFIEADWTQDRE